jgi:hypothetical protein
MVTHKDRQKDTCPNATWFTRNPTWTALELYEFLRGKKKNTNSTTKSFNLCVASYNSGVIYIFLETRNTRGISIRTCVINYLDLFEKK